MSRKRANWSGRIWKRALRSLLLVTKGLYQALNSGKGSAKHQVVFVAGAQRSGTNMLMDVLERSYETAVYHETDARAFDNYSMRPIPVIHRLIASENAPRIVIKALCESQDLPGLLAEFKPAKAIWVVRHFDDVVNSMNISFPNQKNMMLSLRKDREAGGWRTQGMSDETYRHVLPQIDEDMSPATAAALQWYLRNRLFFELGLNTRNDVLLVAYENLAQNPVAAFRRIAEFIGIEPTEFMTKHVHARSVGKRPSPDLSAETRRLCEELWDRFCAPQD